MIGSRVRILAYHSLTPWDGDRLGVSPEQFAGQMEWLADQGWNCLSLTEWLDIAQEGRVPDHPSFVLTFDDGYLDNLEIAAPILRSHGWSATVFVVTRAMETGLFPTTTLPGMEPRLHASPRRSLTWKDAETWCQLGFDVGSHSETHPLLTRVDQATRLWELRRSKTTLQERLGVESPFFCYPFGGVDPALEAEVRAAGYRGAVLTPPRTGIPVGLWTIDRVGIYSHDNLARFRLKMHGGFRSLRTVRQRLARRTVHHSSLPRVTPLRSLQVLSSTGIGGIERMLPRLAPKLACRMTATNIFAVRPGGPAEPRLRRAGLKIRSARTGSLPIQLQTLRRIVRWNEIDILHAYGGRAILLSRLATIGMGNRRPRVVTGLLSTSHASRPLHWILEWITSSRSDLFIANAKAVAHAFCSRVPVDPSRIRVVYDGIERETLQRAERSETRRRLGIPQTAPVLVCVANLRPMKGHRVLLAAFEQIAEQLPDARLLLVGADRMNGAIQVAARRLRSAASVLFLGPRSDVAELLASADLFVLASDWEGLPVSILEAMRAGLPIVATEVSGIPEAIRHGRDGLLVPRGDPDALAHAILSTWRNGERRRRMARSAAARLHAHFTIDRMAEDLSAIYRSLVVPESCCEEGRRAEERGGNRFGATGRWIAWDTKPIEGTDAGVEQAMNQRGRK